MPTPRYDHIGRVLITLTCILAGVTSATLFSSPSQENGESGKNPTKTPDQDGAYRDGALPVLTEYCFDCHGPDKQKGSIRFDEIDPDMLHGPHREVWEHALELLRAGEMPPRKAKKPSTEEKDSLIQWITSSLREASKKRGQRGAVLRRLNREQYTRSLQDLLGLSVNFGRSLPTDGKSHTGFTNNGEVLRSSTLHLEYFQAIARDALNKAIVMGDKPSPTHYRVSFGKGLGKGLPGAKTGGYQAVPLDPDDFVVDILDVQGNPKASNDEAIQKELDGIKRKVTVGLRGSSQDRFHVVDDGVILYSALPHKEVAPGAWQGPSPNLKLEMQRVFPDEGDFAMRVEASRGYLVTGRKELLVSLEDPQPLARLVLRNSGVLANSLITEAQELAMKPTRLDPWYVAGPILATTGEIARDTQYTSRTGIDFDSPLLDGTTRWTLAGETDGIIQNYEPETGAVLLARTIEAPSARQMSIAIGSDDAVWVWLNGQPVLEADVRRGVAKDQDIVTLNLAKGRNELLMKVVNFGGGFASYHRVKHDGTRLSFPPYDVVTNESARVALAELSDSLKNLKFVNGSLVPEEIPEESRARLRLETTSGYWQFDLVHPAVSEDAMGSIRLEIDGLSLDMRPELTPLQLELGYCITPIGAGYLNEGQHEFVLGGPFFIGFSHLVMTPLNDEHPLVKRLESKAAEEDARLAPAILTYIGTRTDDGMNYDSFDVPKSVEVPVGESRVYEFFGRLEDLPIPEPESGDEEILSGICVLGLWNHHLVKSREETGPPLLIKSIEFEAPYFPTWPPPSHTRIFHESTNRGDEDAYTREVLSEFLPRAFRRPLESDELDLYMRYWRSGRLDYEHYEHSVREVLVAALCSPSFLFLLEPEDETNPNALVSEEALASRLSYFLWNSPPDKELMLLASQGLLRETLDEQVDRLLSDERRKHFVRTFTHEWLRLDRLDGMTINPNLFPGFTRFIKSDMAEETVEFFNRVLQENLSVLTLIDSDFAMLNQNLAEFYGIDGVLGVDFRPVPITPESGRGGLLSQGAFLAGHSDGNEPHPIKRAVWIKEKLLGQPPLPPPPNVPDLDPTAPGFENLTLKERLEQHRNNPSCNECHASFDPYGIALESYSAVGLLEHERKGRPIDASTVLPDGTTIEGHSGIKAYLKEQVPEQFVASLIEHLFAYALGRDTEFADEEELQAILEKVRTRGFNSRFLIHEIISSPSFRDK